MAADRNSELARRREKNGALLNELLAGLPGVSPKKTYPGTTRHGYHLYIFDFDPDHFAGMSKAQFLRALRAEGTPVSGGYAALNQHPFVEQFLSSPGFRRIYSPKRLAEYREQNRLPGNDRLIENTCWLTQNMLLGDRKDIESIAAALEKIHSHAAQLARLAELISADGRGRTRLLIGDLNLTPFSPFFDEFLEQTSMGDGRR